MQINTDGLIIREQSIGESDRLVTVLTREQGILRAFVRGAKAMKSRSASSTQLLCYSRLNADAVFSGLYAGFGLLRPVRRL